MKKSLIACLLVLALLMAGPFLPVSRAENDPYAYSIKEEGPEAQNLTGRCHLSSNLRTTNYTWRLSDDALFTSQIFKAGQNVSLTWKDDVPVRAVWLAFKDYPAPNACVVQQFDASGSLIKEESDFWYVNHTVFLEDQTRSVTVLAKSEINLCSLYAFGEGIVPHHHPWERTPEKLDYLIVAMHPDDDVLFMSAIPPLYTVEQGREGTIFYGASRERVRKDEAGDGAWIMGLRKAPILGTFPDIPPSYMKQHQHTFQQKDVVKRLVTLFRQYRPEVIFSHDPDGEYGHWQHRLLSNAVQEAVPLAADPTYDKKSAEQYGTWQIKKLYLHLYAENPIHLPATKPIAAYGGLTPVEIAAAAFQCHKSQLPSRHSVSNQGVYSMSDFGLAYTAVGLDTPDLNDPFEHIDPATLHGAAAPVPTDVPAPTDTPASTDSPAPTDTPVPAHTPTPTDVPTSEDIAPLAALNAPATAVAPASAAPALPETAVPAEPSDAEEEASPLFWLLPLLIGLAAVLCLGISFMAKKWWQRILLWSLALALSVCAALLLVNGRRSQKEVSAPAAVSATQPIRELSFTTETLPEPSALAAYPDLKKLDVTACQQVTATWYEAIRQAVPPDCQVLWAVPLTDGRFPAESTRLKLPHFSPEDGTLIPYFPQLTAVDASGSAAYDALLALKDAHPDLDLTFTLPVGDQVLTMDDESLTVTEAPDFALLGKALGAFPRLRTLDLTAAPVAPTDAVALSDLYPELAVSYTVPVGSLRFSPDATAIALEGSAIQTVQELLDALPYLPGLQQADLHGTGLGLNDVMALQAARPSLVLSQTVELLDRSVELNAEELDLRNATVPTADLVSLLHPFTALKKVYLPQTEDVEATAVRLQSEHPETVFIRRVTVFGQTIMNDVEELDVSKTPFRTTEEVLSQLSQLPYLKKLVMCDCGLSDEQMEELMAARPEIKFVWNIRLGPHKLRTDAIAFSTKNPTKHPKSTYSDAYNNLVRTRKRLKTGDLKPLKYCTDLVALDLGHNYLTNEDLEVLQYLPHLQLLILADNKITDISALNQLKELRYVELFMNRIPDMSPLVGLPDLVDINIANTHLEDITPLLHFTQAKRLWFSMNGLTAEQNKAVIAALPNCTCNCTTRNETAEGWREGESYQWLRKFFYDK